MLAGCDSPPPPGSPCEDREKQLVQAIDEVGEDLLSGLDYGTSDYSGCEEKGQVDPFVEFAVPGWSSPSEAVARLRERGWRPEGAKGGFAPRSTFRSRDARWVAIAYRSGANRHVTIMVIARAQFLMDSKPVDRP